MTTCTPVVGLWLSPEEHASRLANPTRLRALRASQLLDGATNEVLDRLARLAARLLGVPNALVSLVDDHQQHFPGMVGREACGADARNAPLSHSLCQFVVTNGANLIVDNAHRHPLLRDNADFLSIGVVAYAGVPLRTSGGEHLGAMCVTNPSPVAWTDEQVAILEDLAAAAMAEIELRTTLRLLGVAHEQLEHQVERDALTGLFNRRGFNERARHHLALAQRAATPFSLVALDLDAFKQINDCFGHDIGDEALVEMASLLSEAIRDSDLAARLGGDEFTLLLSGTTGRDTAVFIGRLRSAIDAANAREERDFVLSSSIGVAAWRPEAPQSLATLMRLADEALYADKRARKLHAVKLA